MRIYRHKPLSTEYNEIRLLTIHPSPASSEILISIQQSPFLAPSVLPYEALSYVWGTSASRKLITITDGERSKQFAVTGNLYDALLALRYEKEARVMWIDAICINQRDLDERSTEVSRMGEIYSQASRVVVWLGVESDDSALGMKAMKEMGSQTDLNWYTRELKLRLGGNAQNIYGDFHNFHDLPTQNSIWHLLQRPWFGRLWIWQEIILARSAIIVCGPFSLPWSDFSAALVCIQRQVNRSFHTDRRFELPRACSLSLSRASSLIIKTEYSSLRIWLQLTQHALCSDPHDRIYALLSLTPEFTRTQIVPDYSKALSDLFIEVASMLITETHSLSILTHCSLLKKQMTLPSWTPDWSIPSPTNSISCGNASGRSYAEVRYLERTVEIAGVASDRLTSCGRNITSSQEQSEDTANFNLDLYTEWEPANILTLSYLTGEPLLDAYSVTLIGNLTAEHDEYSAVRPTVAESRSAFLRNFYSGLDGTIPDSQISGEYCTLVGNICTGRVFVQTEKGYIGLAPETAKVGDMVCTFLGGKTPFLIRPTGEQDHYLLVGSCYIHGLMDSEALLGPLPKAWHTRYSKLRNWLYISPDGDITNEDPRLRTLSSDWEVHYNEGPSCGPWPDREPMIRNRSTGRSHWGDPRLTSTALKARGVDIQNFMLV